MAIQRDATVEPATDAPAHRRPSVSGQTGLLDPASLTIEQAAKLLAVDGEAIGRHVDAGLPTGLGGTINLVTYAAWLNRELVSSGESDGD